MVNGKRRQLLILGECLTAFACFLPTDAIGTFEKPLSFTSFTITSLCFCPSIYLSVIFSFLRHMKRKNCCSFVCCYLCMFLMFLHVYGNTFLFENLVSTCLCPFFPPIVVKRALLGVYSTSLNVAQLSEGNIFPVGC